MRTSCLLMLFFLGLTARSQSFIRPQTPQPPFPYRTLEVSYDNPSVPGVKLAATLTLPQGKGKFPAVLLLGGSGQFPRDQPFFGHKMPLVLADYLTRRGFAVLRFDDRGTGQSTLGPKPIHQLTTDDFVADARAGITFLRGRSEIDAERTGLLGSSEGTLIAQILAAERPREIAFIVLLAAAGPDLTKADIVATQSETMARLSGLSPAAQQADREFMREALGILVQEPDHGKRLRQMNALAEQALTKVPEKEQAALGPAMRTRAQIFSSDNFYQDAITPRRDYLQEVRCPVLALNGGKDVLISAEKSVPQLKASLRKGGNPDYEVKIMPELNHMFQTAKTGLMEEAKDIEETLAPQVLQLIGNWLSVRMQKL